MDQPMMHGKLNSQSHHPAHAAPMSPSAQRVEEGKSAIIFDDRMSDARAECGLCEFSFPVSGLLCKLSFKAIAQWREDHGASFPPSDKRLRKTRLYDNTPICLFCSQFFDIHVFEILERERTQMRNEFFFKTQKSGSKLSKTPVLSRPLSRIGRQMEISNLKMRSVVLPRASSGPSKSASVAVLEVKAKTNSSLIKSMRELAKMEMQDRDGITHSASRGKSKSPSRASSPPQPLRTTPAEAIQSRIEKRRAMLAALSAKYQQEESPVKARKEKGRAKSSPSKLRNSTAMPLGGADVVNPLSVISAPSSRKRDRRENNSVQKSDGFLDDLVSAKQELRSQIAGLLEQQHLLHRGASPSRVTFQEGEFTVARNRSPGGAATPTKSAATPGSAERERRPLWIDTCSSVSGVFPSLQELKRRVMSDPSNKAVVKEDTSTGQGGKVATPKKKKSGKAVRRGVSGKQAEGLCKKRMQRAKRLVKNVATAYVGPEVDEIMDQLGFKNVEDISLEEGQPATTHSPTVRRRPIKKASEGESIISRKQFVESKNNKKSQQMTPIPTDAQPGLTGILKKHPLVAPSSTEAGFQNSLTSVVSPLQEQREAVSHDDDDYIYANDFEADAGNTENVTVSAGNVKIQKKNAPAYPTSGKDIAAGIDIIAPGRPSELVGSAATSRLVIDAGLTADDDNEYNQEEFEVDDDGTGPNFFLTADSLGADMSTEVTIAPGCNSQNGGMESVSGSKFESDERPSTSRLNSRGSFSTSMELMGDRQFVASRGRTPTSRGKSSRRRRRLVGTPGPGSPAATLSRAEIHSPMADPPQSMGDDDGAYMDDFEAEAEHLDTLKQSPSSVSPTLPKRVTFSPITAKEKAPLELGVPKAKDSSDESTDEIPKLSFKEFRTIPESGIDVARDLDPKDRASMNAFVSSLFELKDGEEDLDVYGEEQEVDFDAGSSFSKTDGSRTSSSLLMSSTFVLESDEDGPRAPQRRAPKDRASVLLPRGVSIAQLAFANREDLANPNKVFEVGVTTRSRTVLPRIANEVQGYPSQLDLRIMRASGELATKRKEKVIENRDEFSEKIKQFAKKNQATSSVGGRLARKR